MSERDETDAAFADVFKTKFGASVNTKARLKAERRAGRSPKERNRVAKGDLRNVQINIRATQRTKGLLDMLADTLEKDGRAVSQADVIEMAIRELAKSNGIGAA